VEAKVGRRGQQGKGRPGQRRKGIPEVVQYALGHRIRVHILITLNEGVYTAAQLAAIIGEPLNNVSNHVRELLDAGSIEIAKKEQKANLVTYYYRAVEIPFYSREEAEEMTWGQRQVTAGLVLQGASAEVMAGLWSGNLADPRTVLTWDWFNVDEEGREAIEEELARSWERIREIEVEATNRRARSGEEATSVIVTQLGYERARKARTFRAHESVSDVHATIDGRR
jgi:DNA-binding transcriptional ArsR family regulator